MERLDISRLRKNRSIYLKLGFILSLCFSILAFEWTVNETTELTVVSPDIMEDELVIERTVHEMKKQLPPPKPKIKDKIDFSPEPEFVPELPPEPTPNPDTAVARKVVQDEFARPKPTLPKPPVVDHYKKYEEEAPLIIAEVMPRFPGCEELDTRSEKQACANKKLLQFIGESLKYPSLAREADIQGTVVIRFVVEKDGSISNAEVVRDIGGGCGKEALRVVNKMPTWIPGSQQGHKVRVQFNLPIRFKLQ